MHISKTIRCARLSLATATAIAGAACGRPTAAPAPVGAPPGTTRILPLDLLYVLEVAGVPPEDTTVTFAIGTPRVIVLRHGPPDNTVFVEISFADSAFVVPDAPDSVTVVVRPRPGLYALDLATTVLPRGGGVIRFKYPVHFSAPLDAIRRYGSQARYEQALRIATLVDGTNYALLPSQRPASDNLLAALPGPGTYLVAAPR
jgi:hypothetical protein